MKDVGIVQGSEAQAKDIIISADKVYVHSDIKKVQKKDEKDPDVWEYHEVQYGKDEYIELIAEKNKALEKQVTDTQLALTELYEMKEV